MWVTSPVDRQEPDVPTAAVVARRDSPRVAMLAGAVASATVEVAVTRAGPIPGVVLPDGPWGLWRALAIEHGLALVSADGDFARFPGCAGSTHSLSEQPSSAAGRDQR